MALHSILLSGGAGTRLWPMSRLDRPKQFLSLLEEKSLFQQTLERLPSKGAGDTIVICNDSHRFLVSEQADAVGAKVTIALEPVGRNTAPAIAAGALLALRQDPEAMLLVMPTDHIIEDVLGFHMVIEQGVEAAKTDAFVTFGIIPDHPATGYGYIEKSDKFIEGTSVNQVQKFVEKPCEEVASQYVSSGNFLWNSGVFIFKASAYLAALEVNAPEMFTAVSQAVKSSTQDMNFIRLDEDAFSKSPANSIDYAIMEDSKNVAVIPVSIGWNDVGSWKSIATLDKSDESGNVLPEGAITVDTNNCYIKSDKKIVGAIGIRDLVIVDTDDALLISHMEKTESVKIIAETLKKEDRAEYKNHTKVFRPWGNYQVIDSGQNYQVKNIEIKPQGILSLQTHKHRSEHWVIVEGAALVTLGEEVKRLIKNESVYIPVGTLHRLENPGPETLKMIEVQSGDYLGEDDIVRYEDIYGRVKK